MLLSLVPDRVALYTAWHKECMIGGIWLLKANRDVSVAFYISHDQDYQEHRPVNSVYHQVIKWGWESGFKYLDLGTFTLNMQPNWGLGRFKEGFGARGYLRETFELRF